MHRLAFIANGRFAAMLAAFIIVQTGLAVSAGPAANGPQILISPLRQVLTLEQRRVEYAVANPSGRIVDVRAAWMDLRATKTGYAAAEPDLRRRLSAAPFLTIEPAFLRLNPGERGVIAVAVRPDRAPPPGERRSHLLVETEAQRTPLRRTGGGLRADIGLSVTTPVILRVGRDEALARFSNTQLVRDDDGLLELETTLERVGGFSAYGKVEVAMRRRAAGAPSDAETILAQLDNIAVYTEAPGVTLRLPLDHDFLPDSVLTIRYVGGAEYEGRVFDARSFSIAGPS